MRRVFLTSELRGLVSEYLEPAEIEQIRRAYRFSTDAHDGQHRASGEPYIHHPVQVAKFLARMRLDHETIIAALLHDVIEDTETAKTQIAIEFGDKVAELVDGVSKLTHLSFESQAEAQAENFRKMLMAMVDDIRVMLIKLADRVHNMRTLEALPLDKQRRIARETMEIYSPIANRLGLRNIQTELEDRGFCTLYPKRHRVLAAQIGKMRMNRRWTMRRIKTALSRRLRHEGVKARVEGREKHLYGVYRKMCAKRERFQKIFDVYGFRILVERLDDCYRSLGVAHGLHKPVPKRFKDYIAIPKANGYQSLHTTLFGPDGVPIEVQIRTEEMHQVAESGVAAHWIYKTGQPGANTAQIKAQEWVRDLIEMQAHAGDSFEFFEGVKVDLFPKEIYVFTPAGKIMELPREATPIDFAYAVHTDIGHQCTMAEVDGRYEELNTRLTNGQTIRIVTTTWHMPSAGWLDFAVTVKARAAIRSRLKHLSTANAIESGEKLLTASLDTRHVKFNDMPAPIVNALLDELNLTSKDALFEEIGFGKRPAPLIAERLAASRETPAAHNDHKPDELTQPGIRNAQGAGIDFGKCCCPIPGDPVIGFVTGGGGFIVHTTRCKHFRKYSSQPDLWAPITWKSIIDEQFLKEFQIAVRIVMANRKGVLGRVAAALADMDANIDDVNIKTRDDLHFAMNFAIKVRDRVHLARIMRRLRGIGDVSHITRTGL